MWIIISYLAAILTTISFVPQAIKTIRTRDTRDLSLTTYVMFVCGTIGWTVFGLIAHEYAVFYANFITTMFAGVILFFKIIEPKQQKKPQE